MSSITKVLWRHINKQQQNRWYESYWMVDMHGVITRPHHAIDKPKIDFYPFAISVLKYLTVRDDVRLILHTSSYPDQIENYIKQLKEYDIAFDYLNENPEIRSYEDFGYYESKPYFDIYLDDKAGFDPESDWEEIDLIMNYTPLPNMGWKNELRRRLTLEEEEVYKKDVAKGMKQIKNMREQLHVRKHSKHMP